MHHQQGIGPDRQPAIPAQRDGANAHDPGQGGLFAQVEEAHAKTDAFLRFHRDNPQVYIALRDLARDWRRTGKPKCGIRMFYEAVRWRFSMKIVGGGMYEMNDHHMAFYARALMHYEADLDGLFDTRKSIEADAWIEQIQATEKTVA